MSPDRSGRSTAGDIVPRDSYLFKVAHDPRRTAALRGVASIAAGRFNCVAHVLLSSSHIDLNQGAPKTLLVKKHCFRDNIRLEK